MSLDNYNLENAVFHVLHHRTAYFTNESLTQKWYHTSLTEKTENERFKCVLYFLKRTEYTLKMLEKLDVIKRYCQFARVVGIDLFSVFTRGSQYCVESIILRVTKMKNYILFSPSKKEVSSQHPPKILPLVIDPIAGMHSTVKNKI